MNPIGFWRLFMKEIERSIGPPYINLPKFIWIRHIYLNLVTVTQFHIHCAVLVIVLEAVHVSVYKCLLIYAECVVISFKARDCAKGCITSRTQNTSRPSISIITSLLSRDLLFLCSR